MSKTLVFTIILVVYAARLPSFAVDADLYSLDSFIDPRILGYDFDSEDQYSDDISLLLSNVRVGYAGNYQEREIFTESDAGFGQFDIHYYRNATQWGYRFHRFDSDIEDSVPQDRHKVFFGVYDLIGENLPASRYLFTYEQYDIDNERVEELGMDLDLVLSESLFSGRIFNANSGMSFKFRDQEGETETRILLRYSIYDFPLDNTTFRLSTGLAKIDGEVDAAITKLAISGYKPLPFLSSEFHIYWAFTYRPEREDIENKSNNEVGAFINIPLFLNTSPSRHGRLVQDKGEELLK